MTLVCVVVVCKVASGRTFTEVDVDRELTARRAVQPGFVGLSFPTIAGAGPNGAVIHYHAEEGSCGTVDKDTLLLIDSGGECISLSGGEGHKNVCSR